MKHESLHYLGAAALALAWVCAPAKTEAAKKRNLSVSLEGSAQHCSDLKVRSDGELARSAETFTLSKSEAPILEIQDSAGHGVLHVRGWDRAEYSIEACKLAVADDRASAEAALRAISVGRNAGRFTTAGPSDVKAHWQLYFIVHAPRDGRLDLETKNGPIDVSGVNGSLKLRASNGPISLKDCAGLVEASAANGPISFTGSGGEVHLIAKNGPISLDLTGEMWNGPQLDARTMNGPISLSLGEVFRSGVRVESDGNSPLSCGAPMCRNAWRNDGSRQKTLQMNGSQDTIRLTTNNGPVSVGLRKSKRVL
jgi:hypothetical protein